MKIYLHILVCLALFPGFLPVTFDNAAFAGSIQTAAPEPESDSSLDVHFSLPGGFYTSSQSFQLFVSGDVTEVSIYYTRDGSDPAVTDMLYQSPIVVDTTTVIRARAFADDLPAGAIATQTFFINQDCTLPIVSLATDPYNLWDEDYGIYVKGKHAQSATPHYGANFWMDWERPAHIEFYEPGADSAAFALNVGIKIFGGWSRANDQKSIAFYARKKYDQRDIDYQIFPNRDITHFEAFVMRNSGNDWKYTMMRDGFMQTLLEGEMDLETLAFRPAVMFLNGQYWGILNLREKVNDRYLQAHKNIDPDYIDLLESDSVVLQGSNAHYREMQDYLNHHDMSEPATCRKIESLVDVENYFHYMLAQIYFGNTDWPGNNIKYWRPSLDGGKWRWIIFDTDFGFGLYDQTGYLHNTLEFATTANGPAYPNPPSSTFLLRKLLENLDFRNKFINQFADHLNTTFRPNRIIDFMDHFLSIIEPEISRHCQKWPESALYREDSINRIIEFAEYRGDYIFSFIQEKFALRGTYILNLEISGSTGSRIAINSHTINGFPWEGEYFLDVPVTLTAIPEAGYVFTGWSGDLKSDDLTIVYPSTKGATIIASFAPALQSLDTVVINEINYNSNSLMNPRDWVEFYNYSTQTIDLQGWLFRDNNDTHEFRFPANCVIPALGYLVLCRDTLDFKQVHSGKINLVGNLNFDISNDGELLRLYNSNLALVDSIHFTDQSPWPAGADGFGFTLELIDPLADNLLPQNWQSSSEFGGSPGRNNSLSLNAKEKVKQVNSFNLAQNYPNPFNTATRLQYTLAENCEVSLKVYNINGRLVDRIIAAPQRAGVHNIIWSGDLASGVYYYRLEASGSRSCYVATKKMVFIK